MCVYKYIHTYRKKYTYRCVCVYTVYVYTYTYMCIYILTHRYIYYLLVHSPNGSNGQGRVRLNILKVTEFYLFFNIIFLIGREIDKMKGRERERESITCYSFPKAFSISTFLEPSLGGGVNSSLRLGGRNPNTSALLLPQCLH